MRGQLRHRHYSLSPAHPQLLPRAALESTTVSGLSAKTVPSGLEESATASEGGLPKATAAHGSRGSARCGKSGAVQRPRCGFFGLVRRCLPHEQRTSENPKKRNGFCDAPDHQGGGSKRGGRVSSRCQLLPRPRRRDRKSVV